MFCLRFYCTRSGFLRPNVKSFLILLLLCLWSRGLLSQELRPWSVESRLYLGKIVKHNPEIIFDPPPLTYGFEIGMQWQTYGRKVWQEWQGYPKIGLALSYFNLGERDTVGNAYAVRYSITKDLWEKEKWHIDFQFGGGFAWLDRPFNRLSNPSNNAIGSALNAFALINFRVNYQLNTYWTASAGISLTHYSNGAGRLPNLGINVPSLNFGMIYSSRPLSEPDFIRHKQLKAAEKRFGLRLEYGIGYREIQTTGGPRYPIRSYNIAGRFTINKVNHAYLGLLYEFNQAVYAFSNEVFQFDTERETFWVFPFPRHRHRSPTTFG